MINSPNTPEQHLFFPSGEWEGFYKDPRSRCPTGEMAMTLDFPNGHVIRPPAASMTYNYISG
jgi:hypothetical protein